MGTVRIRSRYEEEHMGYVWYLIVDDVATQGFDSFWGGLVAGLALKKSREDKLDYVWDVSMELSRLWGGEAILYYKEILNMIGEK